MAECDGRRHEPRDLDSRVYEDLEGSDGSRELVYTRTIEGVPWDIVVIRPYETVLSQATEISTPLMILFVIGGLVVSISVPWLALFQLLGTIVSIGLSPAT